MSVDAATLSKFKTRYDASKVFAKGKKIFYYFSAKHKEDNTHIYYLFNPKFNFDKNFELMQKKFELFEGWWHLYTNNELYPKEQLTKETKIVQLELF